MSKNSFHIERVSGAAALEKSFEPTLKRFKARKLSPGETMAFLKSSQEFDLLEKDYLRYITARQEIEALRAQGRSWKDIFSTGIDNSLIWALEAFLDAVEAEPGTQITDVDLLADITGIVDGQELQTLLFSGRESKYTRALRKAIEEGAMFPDLQLVEPSIFGLPESWDRPSGGNGNKRSSIIWAIGEGYAVSFLTYNKVSPHLRSIAQDLNAPYSVIVEAFEEFHDRRRKLHPNQTS